MAETFEKELLRRRVYYAARDGMLVTVYALLADRPRVELSEYLEYSIEENGHKCTPLIIAAKNGHNNIIEMLLNKFKANVEQEGTVQFDGYVIEGATPLWCAAGAGHLNVVKCLVNYGANVNHPTRTNSTPLRAACFDGRLDIVKYLVDNGADIHIANKYNNTCLMIASYKGHHDVVNYLLERGADPDVRAHCGATALHFAAEQGHLEIVKELLRNGATVMKNVVGMTPVLAAAERTKSEVVEYFINQSWCSKINKIEALELLGASYANDKDHYSLTKAFYYLSWAMKERFLDRLDPIPKKLIPPIPAYENRIECQTLEELNAIQFNPNALHMESLVIRERILGPNNPEVPHPVIFRGAVFADNARFDRCIQLWLHALRLRHGNHVTVRKDLLRFAQVFSQMIHIGIDLPFEYNEEVIETAVEELERNVQSLCNCGEGMMESQQEDLEYNVHTVLYLLVIVTKFLKKCTKEQETHIYQLVYRLNRLALSTRNNSTLLHLTVNADTPVDDFHTKNVCRFPCAATARLLIQCGADVNAIDDKRNTPLHIIVGYQKPISDFLTLHSIITALIEAGAHMDSVNNNGETPFDAATTGVAEIILRTQAKLSLKCIAAKAVKKFNLTYEGHVPETLVGFIEMHGVPSKPLLRQIS
ncbi:protein fem-1 homolog B-like [Centruroides sculpturatus]|uniref:protein fem-1 homolog B-like n=1 Tax=Centruroides sculpturatus TaxID=218467 RepID=UPI000C6CE46E|nr:protein fem-1 homolog B-like [Centruroides sculpturatus]